MSSIIIPDNVITIEDNAFTKCSQLSELTLGQSLKSIGTGAFRSTGLLSLTVPSHVESIGPAAFSSSFFFLGILPVEINCRVIGAAAFAFATSMEEVTLGDNIEIIHYKAFFGSSLKSLSLPRSIKYLGRDSFQCLNFTTIIDGTDSFLRPRLQSVIINSPKIHIDGTAFSNCIIPPSGMVYNKNLVASGVKNVGPIALSCTKDKCGCIDGYGNGMLSNPDYFNCVPCELGKTSYKGNQKECHLCGEGRYAARLGQAECTPCNAGKYYEFQGAASVSNCQNCTTGKYAATPGQPCLICPPGSSCPHVGLTAYQVCDVGHYSHRSGQTECHPCPPGRFQNRTGQAYCDLCPAGKYLPASYGTSESQCLLCPVGKYGDNSGLGNCTACPSGQYQTSEGQEMCIDCSNEGRMMTNNEDHSACIFDNTFISRTIVEILFEDGVAWAITLVITIVFVIIMACVQYERERCSHNLGQLSRTQVLLKSSLPGFSFISEILLIVAIYLAGDAPVLANLMLFFRLIHAFATAFVFLSLFGTRTILTNTKKIIPHIDSWRKDFDYDYAKRRIHILSVITLLCMCDFSMVQMLPWKKYQILPGKSRLCQQVVDEVLFMHRFLASSSEYYVPNFIFDFIQRSK